MLTHTSQMFLGNLFIFMFNYLPWLMRQGGNILSCNNMDEILSVVRLAVRWSPPDTVFCWYQATEHFFVMLFTTECVVLPLQVFVVAIYFSYTLPKLQLIIKLQTSIMAVHAEWLHFAHLLILYFPFEQSGFIGFTRVQMRCVTTVSTLTPYPVNPFPDYLHFLSAWLGWPSNICCPNIGL